MDLNCLKDCVILYVEDEGSVQNQTKMILDDFVKEVKIAKDGEQFSFFKTSSNLSLATLCTSLNPAKNVFSQSTELKKTS